MVNSLRCNEVFSSEVILYGLHHRQWKEGLKVHYETAGTEGPPVLLLTGFGVGGFHYERNVAELAQNGKRVWVCILIQTTHGLKAVARWGVALGMWGSEKERGSCR